jgi:peptidoglycan-associated lipoprotein
MLKARLVLLLMIATLTTAVACGGKKPPVANPTTPPSFPTAGSGSGSGTSPGSMVPRAPDPPVVRPPDPAITSDPLATRPVDWINDPANSPLKPAYFQYDSDQLDDAARKTLEENGQVLKKYPTWVITIEGHCDERGTAEYNLSLGDRRALAAKTYLLSLGIASERLRTVSYGKEFPFDPGHEEGAWSKNRRAHFMLTAKQ